ncbi:MAG: DUF2860 family protein [Desulfobacteraceae bacterium]|nr:DUF2860 family protein [Desulfobacteraceae bacterium]
MLKILKPISLIIVCSAIIHLIIFFFVSAHAGEPEADGFSGHLMAGGAFTAGKPSPDNASANQNPRISSLSQFPEHLTEINPVGTGELNFTFAFTGTTVSLVTGSGPSVFVISQPAAETGTFSLGLNYMKDEVWQDPFIIGTNRTETSRRTKGLALSWDNILNSGFNFSYALDDVDIENDLAGKRHQGLKRDGKRHAIKGGSRLFATDTSELSAGVIYERSDMAGKNFSYDGYGIELTHVLRGGGWDLGTAFSVSYHGYDGIHPEFNRDREDRIFILGSAFTLHEPLELKHYFITLFGSAFLNDSSICFYDESSLSGGLGIGYQF